MVSSISSEFANIFSKAGFRWRPMILVGPAVTTMARADWMRVQQDSAEKGGDDDEMTRWRGEG